MRITVLQVQSGEGAPRVTFASACGRGAGLWMGPAPAAGSEHFVELHSDEALQLTGNAEVGDSDPGMALADDGVVLSARLETITDEGTGIFRCCDASLVLELADAGAWHPGGSYVLRLHRLALFDQQL